MKAAKAQKARAGRKPAKHKAVARKVKKQKTIKRAAMKKTAARHGKKLKANARAKTKTAVKKIKIRVMKMRKMQKALRKAKPAPAKAMKGRHAAKAAKGRAVAPAKPVIVQPAVVWPKRETPAACVLYGYGINCDYETQHAFASAGAIAERVHVNDLVSGSRSLTEFEILAFAGGFSFGDDIGSGKVLANKFKFHLEDELLQFVKEGKLVAGICNGFQSIVKLGLLPAFGGNYRSQTATLSFNDSGRFEDRWVRLAFDKKSPCVWTHGIERLYLPVRHGEGKFVASDGILKKMEERHCAVGRYVDEKWRSTMEYPDNPNGSMASIAAACDESGRVFGIMPHPEAFNHETNHPRWTRGEAHAENGLGLAVFANAVKYAREKLL